MSAKLKHEPERCPNCRAIVQSCRDVETGAVLKLAHFTSMSNELGDTPLPAYIITAGVDGWACKRAEPHDGAQYIDHPAYCFKDQLYVACLVGCKYYPKQHSGPCEPQEIPF